MENKKKILIVEDEVALRDALHDKFTQKGFITFLAKDGEEGLALATTMHPDLIVLDILMPKMDGITMLKKLREDEKWGKDVRVIMLTNLSETGKVASDLTSYNVYEYFVKTDCKIEDLVDKVCKKFCD